MNPTRLPSTAAAAAAASVSSPAAPRRVFAGAAAVGLVLLAATHVSARLPHSPVAAGTVVRLGKVEHEGMEELVMRHLASLPAGSAPVVVTWGESNVEGGIERWAAYDPASGKLSDGVGRPGEYPAMNEFRLPGAELRLLFRDPSRRWTVSGPSPLSFANASLAFRLRPAADAAAGL